MTQPQTRVALLDDGELDDIRQLLTETHVAYNDGEHVAAEGQLALLVTNARRALEARELPPAGTHLVVYDEVSQALRAALDGSDCDLALQRPIDIHAFRLVMSHSLYAGPERRRSRRVVLAQPVTLRADSASHPATLVSLSLRGCGLLTPARLRVGSEVALSLPREFTLGESLELRGPVLSTRESAAEAGRDEVSMAFRLVDGAGRRVLTRAMDRHGRSSELRPHSAPAEQTAGDAPPADGADRRDAERRSFTQRVMAAGTGISHVLIGRDLSSGGMRVAPDADLEVGDKLRIAVHGRPGLPVIMVKAVVARDDDEAGVVLRFQDVPPSIAARLEEIVATLPPLPSGDRAAPGVVVSEVLGRG
jgi:hypothetical protein